MKNFYSCLLILTCIGLSACTIGPSEETISSDNSRQIAYIENKGSDTMVNMALAWAEHYQQINPEAMISVTGGGSGTGLAALSSGTVDIANASRQIKEEERILAEKEGYNPVEFVVARDAIAVIVNLENPIDQLTLEQVSQIYQAETNNWSEIGGDDRPIVRLSRETNSGTHIYFLESVVRLGEAGNKDLFSTDTLLLPSSEGIIAEVRDNPNAIGYDGLGYITDEVKVIAIAQNDHSDYVMPSVESVTDSTYPIARDLYMYTLTTPEGVINDYLEWIRSSEAQMIVADLGFVPVTTIP